MNECPKCNHVIDTVDYGDLFECEHCGEFFSEADTYEIGKSKNKLNVQPILNFANMLFNNGQTLSGETIENFAVDKLKQLEKMLSEHCKVTTEEKYKVYVIECTDSKFFVIRSTLKPNTILKEKLCAFTDKYPSLSIHEVFQSSDPLDEDIITKKQMMKFGIDNVRGGSYSSIDLEDWQVKSLNNEFERIKKQTTPTKNVVDDYLDKFKTVNQIDIQITKLLDTYHNIVKLKNKIKISTIETKYTNVDEIFNELIKNDSMCQNQRHNLKHFPACNPGIKENLKQAEDTVKNNFNDEINQKYKQCFTHDTFNDIEYLKFKILAIRNYNADHKKELNTLLLQEHVSDEIISNKLESLYGKRLKLLS